MKQRVLLIGASGGVGSACSKLLSANNYEVIEWTSRDLDLNFPEHVFACDFAPYDILINCAGHSQGTYRGFLQNSWANQVSQIMVNYVSALAVLKHYALSRTQGKYVYCSSDRIDTPSIYQSVYASAKAGTKFAMDLIRKEAVHISILEIKFGVTKTQFRSRNFEGTRSIQEVEQSYAENVQVLLPEQIAENMLCGIQNNLTEVKIKYE